MRQISIANRGAAQNSERVSAECVVGHLLPVGIGEVTPYGIEDGIEYMPGFVTEQLAATGITGLEVKRDEDGKPLKPRWEGMTLKSERVEGRGQLMSQVHVFGNVAKPIGDIVKGNGTKVFWKIAGENEPKKISVNVNWPKERNKVPRTWPPRLKSQQLEGMGKWSRPICMLFDKHTREVNERMLNPLPKAPRAGTPNALLAASG